MNKPKIIKASEIEIINKDWGQLKWFANYKLGNSKDMTVGMCILNPGKSNSKHSHPNCSEVLHVIQGRILHTYEKNKDIELNKGDTVTIPKSFPHRAKNIGNEDAVLMICYSSGKRKTKGE